jgi:hypothetical protein
VQTFMPYSDVLSSVVCLDRQRLGKQRIEALQILRALKGITKGWRNHPATRMWEGFEVQLAYYGAVACEEWIGRGYNDTTRPKFLELEPACREFALDPSVWPGWMGNLDFHLSHRSNLVRKYPEHYRIYFGDVPDDLPYVWPRADGSISE